MGLFSLQGLVHSFMTTWVSSSSWHGQLHKFMTTLVLSSCWHGLVDKFMTIWVSSSCWQGLLYHFMTIWVFFLRGGYITIVESWIFFWTGSALKLHDIMGLIFFLKGAAPKFFDRGCSKKLSWRHMGLIYSLLHELWCFTSSQRLHCKICWLHMIRKELWR